jgi:serine/threonine-protein kinase RsbW
VETLLLSYVNAGQFRPLLVYQDPDTGLETYMELPGTSCPLSDLIKCAKHEEQALTLASPARLLLFSDGLIERSDNQGEIISTKGLLRYFQSNGLSAASLLDFVNYPRPQTQNDDISYILLDISTTLIKDYYCDLEHVALAMQYMQEELLARYPESPVTSRVLQCYHEIFTNAIEHGHKNDKTKRIRVKLLFGKEKLTMQVADEGAGFNWRQAQLLQKPSPLLPRGRGLYLVKNLSQSLSFNEQGNEITIEFSIPPNNNI